MTQICPKCQNPNRPDARFCAYCRTPLNASDPLDTLPPGALPAGSVMCPQCGKAINPRAKFCNHCGHTLLQVTAAVAVTPPVAGSATASPPPPPYVPPAYTPPKQGLSRRQTVMVAVTSVAVMAILVVLFIMAGSAPQATPIPSATPAPIVTSTLNVVPTQPKLLPTATPRPTRTVPSVGGQTDQRCPQPQPENAVPYTMKKDETLYGIARTCEMEEKTYQTFLRWNQVDRKDPRFILSGDCVWVPSSCSTLLH